MPFTPLHMGPGLAIKALAGPRFSLVAFGVAQIAMDLEPLLGLVRGASVLHGPSHTYLAAVLIAVLVGLVTPVLGRVFLRRCNRELAQLRLDWLTEAQPFTALPVISGAFAGTLSHLLLDSIMHSDIRPLAPWSDANVLLNLISIDALHQFCLFSGLFGAVAWLCLAWRRKRTGERSA